MHPSPGRGSVTDHIEALLGLARWTSRATAPHRGVSSRRWTRVSATSLKVACLTLALCRPRHAGCWRITRVPGHARLRHVVIGRRGGPDPLPERCRSASRQRPESNISAQSAATSPRRRDGPRGRKPRSGQILAGARPPFRHEELRLATRHEYGCVHLPDPAEIRAVAERLGADLAGPRLAGPGLTGAR